MLLLEAINVEKSFSKHKVLKGVSLSVSQGEVISIIGPSGSGKSTFLRCMTSLETADNGTITICGKNLLKSPGVLVKNQELQSIILDIGLVFQNFELFPHMSVIDNLIHPCVSVLDMDKDIARTTALKYLEDINLLDKANAYPCNLSGGQKQRVAICRALILNPKILFFDEPTSALDPELTGEVLRIIKDLANKKMTMVIVTHEMNFAREVSDKVIFMAGGEIIESGSPIDIFDNTKSERLKSFIKQL